MQSRLELQGNTVSNRGQVTSPRCQEGQYCTCSLLMESEGRLGQQFRMLAAPTASWNLVSSTNMASHNPLLSVTVDRSNIYFWPPQPLHICCEQKDRQTKTFTQMKNKLQKTTKVGICLKTELPPLWFCFLIIMSRSHNRWVTP